MEDSIAAGMGCIDKGVGELKGVALVGWHTCSPGWHTHSAARCLHETVLLHSTLAEMPVPGLVPACRILAAAPAPCTLAFCSAPLHLRVERCMSKLAAATLASAPTHIDHHALLLQKLTADQLLSNEALLTDVSAAFWFRSPACRVCGYPRLPRLSFSPNLPLALLAHT